MYKDKIGIIVYGADGVMGSQLVAKINNTPNMLVVAEVTPLNANKMTSLNQFEGNADVLIDFSHPSNLQDILAWGVRTGKALLLCTTGYSEEDITQIKQVSNHCPILLTGNTGIGINIIKLVLEQMANLLSDWDIEIIEKHHNRKKDSPSGTALELLQAIEKNYQQPVNRIYGRSQGESKRQKGDIGLHSVRGGNIVGEHSILFAGNDEIIEINHQAISRNVFVSGAIRAVHWLVGQPVGLYNMRDTFVS